MINSKVLAIKYRPQKLSDLIGQEIVAETILNSLKLNKIPNAYLFHGIRGTGKTSIARIIAKSLNCENGFEKLCDGKVCVQCESINNSSHLDVIEQDCATATGIDSVRDLIEFCRYPPSLGKYKVLILDEIQAMSKAGAQSLLKILEEPPEYVKFIFCTTEIKKILVTIISRCSRFDLSRVSTTELFNYLKKISLLEGGNISDEAIKLICKCSEGSVRDSLSLLDRALLNSTKEKIIDLNTAQILFGHFDKSSILNLLEKILSGDEEKTLKISREIYRAGVEPKTFLNDFLEILYYLKNIDSIKLNGTNFDLNDNEFSYLKELSEKIDNKTLLLYWQYTISNLKEIEIVSNQYISLEMFLIRLMYIYEIKKKVPENNNFSNKTFSYKNKENIVKNNNLNKDINIVEQIKNTIQTDEIKLDEKNIDEKNTIESFNNLIEICKKQKEIKLKHELENNVNLIQFENKRMEISFNENLKKDFVKDLTTKLFEWTGERWIITLSKKKGEISIKEHELNSKNKLMNKFKVSHEFNEIKKHFNDLSLINIKKNDD